MPTSSRWLISSKGSLGQLAKHKRSNGKERSNAKNAVKLWYAHRVENQTNQYRAVDGKPVMVERLVNVQPKERAVPTKRFKKRLTGSIDTDGDPIYEYVPYEAVLTARGTQRKPKITGGNMPVGPSSGFSGEQERYRHNRHLEFINTAMLHVGRVCRESFCALEMDAAGYPTEEIAENLDCGRDMAKSYVDEGIAILISCFYLKPWKIDDAEN